MDRQHPPYGYDGQQQQHPAEYADYSYSYPPVEQQQQQQHQQPHDNDPRYLQAGSDDRPYDSTSSLGAYDNEKQLHRQAAGGYADSDAETRVASLYDEKSNGAQSTAMAAVRSSEDYIPPAIPRPRNSMAAGNGQVSRGSVAIQAAAAGEIPKKEALKMWRSDEHHGTFTAGGKGRAAMRCCCCTLIFAVILIAGIVAAFLLWVGLVTCLLENRADLFQSTFTMYDLYTYSLPK